MNQPEAPGTSAAARGRRIRRGRGSALVAVLAVLAVVAAGCAGVTGNTGGSHSAVGTSAQTSSRRVKHVRPRSHTRSHTPSRRASTAPRLGSSGSGNPNFSFWIYNNTPYTMHLDLQDTVCQVWDGQKWVHEAFPGGQPPDTLEPFNDTKVTQWLRNLNDYLPQDIWVSYWFTDIDGGHHLFRVHSPNAQPLGDGNVLSYSENFSGSWLGPNRINFGGSWELATDVFHTSRVDGAANRVGAYLSKPADITIDATTNPAGATAAMAYWPDADKDSKKYVQTSDVAWDRTVPDQASPVVINATPDEVEFKMGTATTFIEDSSFELEISWEAKLGFLGLVSATVGGSLFGKANLSWSNETGTSDSFTIGPGEKGWFLRSTEVAKITGNFDFTAYDGQLVFHIKNVTVSFPNMEQPGQKIPIPATNFTPHTELAAGVDTGPQG